MRAPVPPDERARLGALRRYEILDTPPERCFDDIVRLSRDICQTPIAAVNFVDEHRQWFKSEIGLGLRETPRDISICAHAILQPGLLIVPDTLEDERFATNPLVATSPRLRFYAGVLLESSDGLPLGTLCVLDYVPRQLTEEQTFALSALAYQVMNNLELRRSVASRCQAVAELQSTQTILREEVEELEQFEEVVVSRELKMMALEKELSRNRNVRVGRSGPEGT